MTRRAFFATAVLFVLVGVAYANHFENGFHFDDWHAIQTNPYITSLANAERFFVDGTTFSSLPSHHGYRPLLPLSFAVDYAIGGGLAPVAFHVTSFLCFLVVVGGVLALCVRLFGAGPLAWCVTALFALHPACAETVNYLVQRGDILSALGCVVPLALYARKPRIIGWHLLIFAVCCFAKPSTVVFAALLAVYVFLYTDGDLRKRFVQMTAHATPAFVIAAAFYALQAALSPATAESGGKSALWYWATQPYVLLHEMRMFVWPDALTADTDMPLVTHLMSAQFLIGALSLSAFVALTLYAAWRSLRDPRFRPVALGLGWFYITNAPTSLIPLAEVQNDHRMFLPFIGLVIALGGGLSFVTRWPDRRIVIGAVALVFAAEIGGTWTRNRVWFSEETLWHDVTLKSPNNGRGLMNYGLTLMSKGQLKEALDLYERAHVLLPNYPYLETNLGIVKASLGGKDAEAERHFQRAVSLVHEPVAHPFFARFLRQRGREGDAKRILKDGLHRQNDHWDMRLALLVLLEETQQYTELRACLRQTRAIFPHRRELDRFAGALAEGHKRAEALATRSASLSVAERCELGRLQAMDGDNAKALQTVQPLLQANADELCAVRVHALAAAGIDDWTTALREGEHALALAPSPDDFNRAMTALVAEAHARQTAR